MSSKLKAPKAAASKGTVGKKSAAAAAVKRKKKKDHGENIKVVVRTRPLIAREKKKGSQHVEWEFFPSSVVCSHEKQGKEFVFDHVFDTRVETDEIYEKVGRDIIWNAMEGYNGTIFAYGQTSSGKTYTMYGTQETPGIIPLALNDMFSMVNDMNDREFLIRVSYMEIFNEVVCDLLAPENTNLKIKEDPVRGPMVMGLKEELVISPDQVLSVMVAGEANRKTAATNFNAQSSRSHSIFRLIVESRKVDGKGDVTARKKKGVRFSMLNLIDLAGSERYSSDNKERLREGAMINRSLLTLGNVIAKLSDGGKGHIPYRDSKLTRILQKSLSGNGKVVLVATMSPSPACEGESLNTLKFAQRAKKVTMSSKIQEVMDDTALLAKYRSEIEKLREELAQMKLKGGPSAPSPSKLDPKMAHAAVTAQLKALREEKEQAEEDNYYIAQQLQEQKNKRSVMEQKIERLTRLILTSAKVAKKKEIKDAEEAKTAITGKPLKRTKFKKGNPMLFTTWSTVNLKDHLRKFRESGASTSVGSDLSDGVARAASPAPAEDEGSEGNWKTEQARLHKLLRQKDEELLLMEEKNGIFATEIDEKKRQLSRLDLRNKQLRSRTNQLEANLKAARAEIEALRASGASTGTPTAAAGEAVHNPLHGLSKEQLLEELRKVHEENHALQQEAAVQEEEIRDNEYQVKQWRDLVAATEERLQAKEKENLELRKMLKEEKLKNMGDY